MFNTGQLFGCPTIENMSLWYHPAYAIDSMVARYKPPYAINSMVTP